MATPGALNVHKAKTAGLPNSKCDPTDSEYTKLVGPLLPTPEEVADKYTYLIKVKEVGNGLFKEKKYEWAIKTYVDGVRSAVGHFFENEGILRSDPDACETVIQLYNNASLCHLKRSPPDTEGALLCCKVALSFNGQDATRAKAMFYKGRALHLRGEPRKAVDCLREASQADPNNKRIRAALTKAQKAVQAQEKKAASRMFKGKSLASAFAKSSKRENLKSRMALLSKEALQLALDHKGQAAIEKFSKVLSLSKKLKDSNAEMQAKFGSGLASFVMESFADAIRYLEDFLSQCKKSGDPPALGMPLCLQMVGLACYNEGADTAEKAKKYLQAYLDCVTAAAPMKPKHNLPDGWGGVKLSALERAVAKWKYGAQTAAAKGKACTLLAILWQPDDLATSAAHLQQALSHATSPEEEIQAHTNLVLVYQKIGDAAMVAKHEAAVAELETQKLAREKKEKAEAEARKNEPPTVTVPAMTIPDASNATVIPDA